MIVLPIGHERGSVRRLPWITFGIMAICVLALVLTSASVSGTEKQAEDAARRLFAFYMQHPHVTISEAAGEILFNGMEHEQGQALSEAFKGDSEYPGDAVERRAVQAEFDALVQTIQEVVDGTPFYRWGLVPDRISIVGLVTHMFMHAGWLHLFGNLLILYLGGPFIEDVWGRGVYSAFYLGAGIFASLLFVGMYPDLDVPLVGASGAIAGVMGAFLVRYWNTPIHFFYLVFFFHGTFTAPAWVMLPLWFLEQLLMASLTHGVMGGGVAYWAHLGGFGFGAGFALLMARYKIEERYISPRLDGAIGPELRQNAVVEQAMQASAGGEGRRGFELLLRGAAERRGHAGTAAALWGLAIEHGWQAEAAPAVVLMIREELRRGDTGFAVQHWIDLIEQVPGVQADPALLLRLARALGEHGRHEHAAGALRLALLDPNDRMTAATALRVAREARQLDDRLARAAARMAIAMPDVSDSIREEAQAILDAEAAEITRADALAVARPLPGEPGGPPPDSIAG